MANNFVSYADMTTLMTAIGNKFSALTGAYIAKGSVAFASLPATLSASQLGFVYNVSDAFTTDSRFVEGSGMDYPAGSNVVVVDADTTGTTPDYKFDVLAGFVDLSDINTAIANIDAMFAGVFDTATAYSIGDVVVKDEHLYKFTSAHAAGAWDSTEVTSVTVVSLINTALATANTNIATAKSAVEATIATEFSTASAYSVGDVVFHEDGLYKFTSAHAAGAWDSTEVTAVTVKDLVDAAASTGSTAAATAKTTVENTIAPAFSTSESYAIGDVVYYEDELYKFNAAHSAGAWTGTDVDAIDVVDLVEDVEPESLTPAQISALEALL